MNNLTFFLYLANIIPAQVQMIAVFLTVGVIVTTLYYLLCRIWADDILGSDSEAVRTQKKAIQERGGFPPVRLYLWSALGFVILNLFPSQELFYMMAASEIGESVITSPDAQAVMSDLKQIIDIQLEQLKTPTP